MVLTLPEGGLAPLPSCGELTFKGLFLGMMEVFGFPAIFNLDVFITLAMHCKVCDSGLDIILVRKVWRGFVEPCK